MAAEESKYIPKDGDFVVSGWKNGDDNECKWIAIVKGDDFSQSRYETYEGFFIEGDSKGKFFFCYSCTAQTYTRAATELEKQLFLEKLRQDGRYRDAEHKCITNQQPKTDQQPKADNVNHPAHYCSDPSGVECIQITKHRNFCVGNAIKYLWRAGLKEDAALDHKAKTIEDLQKADFYIREEIKRLQET